MAIVQSNLCNASVDARIVRIKRGCVELDGELKAYADRIWDLPAMQEWREGALAEKEEIEDLEVEF